MTKFVNKTPVDILAFLEKSFLQQRTDPFFQTTARLHGFYKQYSISNYTRDLTTLDNDKLVRALVGGYAMKVQYYDNDVPAQILREITNKIKLLVGDPSLGDFFFTNETPEAVLAKLNLDDTDLEINDLYNRLEDLDIIKKTASLLRDSNASYVLDEFYQNVFLGEALILDRGSYFENVNIGEFLCYNDQSADLEIIVIPNTTLTEVKEEVYSNNSSREVEWRSFKVYIHQEGVYRQLVFKYSKGGMQNGMGKTTGVYTIEEGSDKKISQKKAFYYRYDGSSEVFPSKSLASMVEQDVVSICEKERLRSKCSKYNMSTLLVTRNSTELSLQYGNGSVIRQPNSTIRTDLNSISSNETTNSMYNNAGSGGALKIRTLDNDLGLSHISAQSPSSDVVVLPKSAPDQTTELCILDAKDRISSILGISLSGSQGSASSATESLQEERKAVTALSTIVSRLRTTVMSKFILKFVQQAMPKSTPFAKDILKIMSESIQYNVGADAISNEARLQGISTFVEIGSHVLGENFVSALKPKVFLENLASMTGEDVNMLNQKGISVLQENFDQMNEQMHVQDKQADISVKQADASLKQQQASGQQSQGGTSQQAPQGQVQSVQPPQVQNQGQ